MPGGEDVGARHAMPLSRSFEDGEGKRMTSTAYRTHDLPLVRFLMGEAHAWCADRRTQDSSCPF